MNKEKFARGYRRLALVLSIIFACISRAIGDEPLLSLVIFVASLFLFGLLYCFLSLSKLTFRWIYDGFSKEKI